MANRTDPFANVISGTDPQNLMEYITRQKIYDSRYWKEECFGLTVADVLTKAASLECIGNLPTRFLSLVLKLLQLHPETDTIVETFIQQEEFKYVRALGSMYLRMTGRPLEIYQSLEPLYSDYRKLRVWNNLSQEWSILHMDEWVHQLLRDTQALGITLPRLPHRRTLVEAAYLPEGPRQTELQEILAKYGGPLEYFRHKVYTERSDAAKRAWEARNDRLGLRESILSEDTAARNLETIAKEDDEQPKKKKEKKEARYGTLFKATKGSALSESKHIDGEAIHDDAYWNEERAKLGLKTFEKIDGPA